MAFEAWFTLTTIGMVMAVLVTNRMQVDTALLGGLIILMVAGVVSPEEAVSGFASTAVLMIGGLFVVAAGLEETGALAMFTDRLLGRPRSLAVAQLRLLSPVALASGFLNNTPIVAMCLPIARDWARRHRLSTAHLLMPLSFAAILGGKLTLIGTASNIVVMEAFLDWLKTDHQWLAGTSYEPMSPMLQFFGIGILGLPTAILGIGLMLLITRRLLPDRSNAMDISQDVREYQVELVVQADSPVIGQTIEQAGLRGLPDLFLSEIERGDTLLAAVAPEEILRAGDRLAFVGVLESVLDLRRRIRGLEPADDQASKLPIARTTRSLVEAVISANSPLVGQSIRKSRFRSTYEAVVIAVHRQGQRLDGKIGDIVLKPGDVLLLETHHSFADQWKNRHDFYLVSNVERSRPVRHERSWVAMGIMLTLVLLLIFKPMNIGPVTAVWSCGFLMVLTRCVTGTVARRAINWQVILAIAAAIGIGQAMIASNAATDITSYLVNAAESWQLGPLSMLIVLFLLASVITQLITPFAAGVLMVPIATEMAHGLHVSPLPFIFTLMMSVGTSFLTPMGYTTNLMVYGPGGYRFLDYTRLGLPIMLLAGVITILLAPVVFPF
ncbi:MAG: SLC13 family permease [Phycisphaerales bacterium]|nr:SLC13 family permease [Phycisphaerales bacterium]